MFSPLVSSENVFRFTLISLISVLCLLILIGLISLYRAIVEIKPKKRLLLKASTTFMTIGGLGLLSAGIGGIILLLSGVQNSQSMKVMPPKMVSCLETPIEAPYVLAIYRWSSGEASGSLFEKETSEAILKSISSYAIVGQYFIGTFASLPEGYSSFWLDFKTGGYRTIWERNAFNHSIQKMQIDPTSLSFQPIDAICEVQICKPCEDTRTNLLLR